jgi:hypothetical protein
VMLINAFSCWILPCFSWFLGTLQCCVLSHDTNNRMMGLLGYDSWVSGPSSPSSGCEPSSCTRSVVLVRLRIFHVVDISWILGIVLSRSFLYCLAELHFVQPLFCDDHHQTRCTLPVHEKVLQPSWVSFSSDAKLFVTTQEIRCENFAKI